MYPTKPLHCLSKFLLNTPTYRSYQCWTFGWIYVCLVELVVAPMFIEKVQFVSSNYHKSLILNLSTMNNNGHPTFEIGQTWPNQVVSKVVYHFLKIKNNHVKTKKIFILNKKYVIGTNIFLKNIMYLLVIPVGYSNPTFFGS